MARLIKIEQKVAELEQKITMLKAIAEDESNPKAAQRAAENLCELVAHMVRAQREIAKGNGPNASVARKFLERTRDTLTANACVLWEVNSAYRDEMTKLFTKEEIDELMKESLRVNPEKKQIRFE